MGIDMSHGDLSHKVLVATLAALLLPACGKAAEPAASAVPPLGVAPAPTTVPPAPTTVPPAPTTVPPEDVSFEVLADMAPPVGDIAGLSDKVVDVGQGTSVVLKTNVDEFNSQSDICLIVNESGDETGRLCADREDMSGLTFMIIPDTSSGRQVAFALVDNSVEIRSMADQTPEHVDLGGASAYFADVSSLPVSEGSARPFRMVVSGPGINAQVVIQIPTAAAGQATGRP